MLQPLPSLLDCLPLLALSSLQKTTTLSFGVPRGHEGIGIWRGGAWRRICRGRSKLRLLVLWMMNYWRAFIYLFILFLFFCPCCCGGGRSGLGSIHVCMHLVRAAKNKIGGIYRHANMVNLWVGVQKQFKLNRKKSIMISELSKNVAV